MNSTHAAIKLWSKLKLPANFKPKSKFGIKSKYGTIFETNGNKIMKIMPWSNNAEREMRIAKIAGNKNVGPKVYKTRVWTPPSNLDDADRDIINSFSNKMRNRKIAVIVMDKIPRAKSLYNAINNGTVKNFSKVENIIKRMHAVGIHHGNLHGNNILVYVTNSGNLKFMPINFGGSNYSRTITNTKSARNYVSKMPGISGNGEPYYFVMGRAQPIISNHNSIRHLREYFTKKSRES